jgi:prepilin-type N-terminal cleavage/methylation domain-containing protein
MLKILKKIDICRPAFSLIEIMAVLLIVSLGIIGIANLSTQSIQAQTINRGSIIAYQLAQEGLEIVRQIRDTNWLQGRNWKTGLASGTYCFDYSNPVLRPVASLNECKLYFDSNNWYYAPTIVPSSVVFSKIRRVVVIDAATSSANVKVIVSWDDRNKIIHYEAETQLYDWK